MNDFIFTHIAERDIDICLAEEFECNEDFRKFFLEQFDILDSLQFVKVVHSVNGLGKCVGETDLLVDFHEYNSDNLIRFLIEDKITSGFTKDQIERYEKRKNLYLNSNACDKSFTVLIAPKNYLDEAIYANCSDFFDKYITYESIISFFSNRLLDNNEIKRRTNFKIRLFEQAICKQKRGWEPINNNNAKEFQINLYDYLQKNFNEFTFNNPINKKIPKESKFIKLNNAGINGIKQISAFLRIKFRRDKETNKPRIDLELKGLASYFKQINDNVRPLLENGMKLRKTGKSISISYDIPVIDFEQKFDDQISAVDEIMLKAQKLKQWFLLNYKTIILCVK